MLSANAFAALLSPDTGVLVPELFREGPILRRLVQYCLGEAEIIHTTASPAAACSALSTCTLGRPNRIESTVLQACGTFHWLPLDRIREPQASHLCRAPQARRSTMSQLGHRTAQQLTRPILPIPPIPLFNSRK